LNGICKSEFEFDTDKELNNEIPIAVHSTV